MEAQLLYLSSIIPSIYSDLLRFVRNSAKLDRSSRVRSAWSWSWEVPVEAQGAVSKEVVWCDRQSSGVTHRNLVISPFLVLQHPVIHDKNNLMMSKTPARLIEISASRKFKNWIRAREKYEFDYAMFQLYLAVFAFCQPIQKVLKQARVLAVEFDLTLYMITLIRWR